MGAKSTDVPKRKKPTRRELERKLKEALAGQAHVYYFASIDIKNASTDVMTTSGVVLTLTALGGKEIIPPVLLRDGLSDALIAAIETDLCRSYELAMSSKP